VPLITLLSRRPAPRPNAAIKKLRRQTIWLPLGSGGMCERHSVDWHGDRRSAVELVGALIAGCGLRLDEGMCV
jgi:hypothetical protein